MAGFLCKTLVVRISQRRLLCCACTAKKYISSMSENESERDRWMDALSSESKDETELMLLMLDIEDMSESLSLERSERGTKDLTVMSWRYLERRARLKEWSTSSNSSRSLR